MGCTSIMRLAAVLTLYSPSAVGQDRVLNTKSGGIRMLTVTAGLEHPWSLAHLPDGRMLVTERPGRLRIVERNGKVSESLKGVPKVFAQGRGGLLDVALDPAFERNRLVYLSYAEPGQGGASTAVARGRLEEDGLEELQVVFRQKPKVNGPSHW